MADKIKLNRKSHSLSAMLKPRAEFNNVYETVRFELFNIVDKNEGVNIPRINAADVDCIPSSIFA